MDFFLQNTCLHGNKSLNQRKQVYYTDYVIIRYFGRKLDVYQTILSTSDTTSTSNSFCKTSTKMSYIILPILICHCYFLPPNDLEYHDNNIVRFLRNWIVSTMVLSDVLKGWYNSCNIVNCLLNCTVMSGGENMVYSIMKQQSVARHVASFGNIILIPSQYGNGRRNRINKTIVIYMYNKVKKNVHVFHNNFEYDLLMSFGIVRPKAQLSDSSCSLDTAFA